jgi:hypothetical protein
MTTIGFILAKVGSGRRRRDDPSRMRPDSRDEVITKLRRKPL